MKINVKNKTAASSLKRKFIETAQNACNAFMMPGGLLADWNVADVKHGKIPNGAWKFRGPRPVFLGVPGLWLDIGYAHAEPRYWIHSAEHSPAVPALRIRSGYCRS